MLVYWRSVDWLVKRTGDVLTWWNSLSRASSRLLSSRKVSATGKVFTMSPNMCLGCLRSIHLPDLFFILCSLCLFVALNFNCHKLLRIGVLTIEQRRRAEGG